MGKQSKNNVKYDQASALPYRYRDGELEVCLITSSSRKRWCFPKGIIDPGEMPAETALKEADEEAGLRGEIHGPPLGEYSYRKWGRSLRVLVLLMEVQEEAEHWDEAHLRDRCWLTAAEADQLLDSSHLRLLLTSALERLGQNNVAADYFTEASLRKER